MGTSLFGITRLWSHDRTDLKEALQSHETTNRSEIILSLRGAVRFRTRGSLTGSDTGESPDKTRVRWLSCGVWGPGQSEDQEAVIPVPGT